MKKLIIAIIALVFSIGTTKAQGFYFHKGDWSSALAKAEEQGKPIFVDIQTKWCKPCRQMDKEVFTDICVISYFRRNYISVKIDAMEGEGVEIARKYGAEGYPTLVFLNSKGEFVQKQTGAILQPQRLIDIAKAASSSKASELNQMIADFEAGKLKHEDLPDYLKLMKEVKMDCSGALDAYVKGVRKKDRISDEVFKIITKYTIVTISWSVKWLTENYEAYTKVCDKAKLDRFICSVFVYESYYNNMKHKNQEGLYKYLEKCNIPFVEAIKENQNLVQNYLKIHEKQDEFIRRSEILYEKYPIIYPNLLNETIKYSYSNPVMAKHAHETIHNFAKINKNYAGIYARLYANIYVVNARDYKNALKYFELARKWSNDKEEYVKESIKYCKQKLGLVKCDNYGQQAPGFTLPDLEGNMVSLKDLRGKYVLIDFWASWCGPCKGEVPFLKEAYNKFKDKDFVLVGISSDLDDVEWRKAVEKEAMIWLQLSSKDTDVDKDYKVAGIPRIMLLDKDGKIIADKLRGKAIEREILKVL